MWRFVGYIMAEIHRAIKRLDYVISPRNHYDYGVTVCPFKIYEKFASTMITGWNKCFEL